MKHHAIPNHSSHYNFEKATGSIDFTFLNDYMFRAILQQNSNVLKALICALLHLKSEDVHTIQITNPIELGKSVDSKSFILDISILMNDNTFIDLELQIKNEFNWEERSLSYLCRSFDQLHSGEDYAQAGPAIHIGLLDFTPFPQYPEFYASYKLLNIRNHHVYSSKFILNVLDLTHIDLATDEDKSYQIDRWARLFKSTTWDELKKIVGDDESMSEASETLYTFNSEETIRAQCRAREDYIRRQKMFQYRIDELTEANGTLLSEIDKLSSENEALRRLLDEHGISHP